jgi:hypothetical protein
MAGRDARGPPAPRLANFKKYEICSGPTLPEHKTNLRRSSLARAEARNPSSNATPPSAMTFCALSLSEERVRERSNGCNNMAWTSSTKIFRSRKESQN